MLPMTIKEFLFNASVVALVVAFFYWLVVYLAKPTKIERDYQRQLSLIDQKYFQKKLEYDTYLLPRIHLGMTDEQIKTWHEQNRMKRDPIVFKWEEVLRIDPNAFRVGDTMFKDGLWYEHNGKEWVMKHKYN